jgi:adenylate cyclase
MSDRLLDAADFLGDRDSTLRGPLRTQIRGRSGTVAVWFWRDESQSRHRAAEADVTS